MAAPNIEEHDEDDWLFTSLKRYKSLHVYDLQHPTQVIEWISGDAVTICIAGCNPHSKRNEILELALPKKISSKGNGLCKDRDFKLLCGGFTDGPVCELRHVPGGRCIVTCENGNNSVHVCSLGSELSDVVKKKISLTSRTPNISPKVAVLSPNTLVFGTNTSDLLAGDLQTYQTTPIATGIEGSMKPHYFANIEMLDQNTCIMCEEQTGICYTYDIRECKLQHPNQPNRETDYWTFAVKPAGHSQVIQVDSQCNMLLFDLRHSGREILKGNLTTGGSDKVLHQPALNVRFAPNQDNIVSLSGCGGMVYLYNLSDKTGTLDHIVPYFTHRGHVMESDAQCDVTVLTHSWHPSQTDVILSTASDSSLHAWQYEPVILS